MSSRRSDERRQVQRDDVQAVVEILAEVARRHLRFDVAVRRRDHAHVDFEALRRADRAAPGAPAARAAASPAAAPACRRSRPGRACPCSPSGTGPCGRACAPVNEPLTWPNSSDSSSCSGIAPQLIATNGCSRRRLALWIARAMQLLAGAGLAVDEDARVAVGDEPRLREHVLHRRDCA